MGIKMKSEQLRKQLAVILLILFFLLAILLTNLSLRNYKKNLTVVPVTQVAEMALLHETESEATLHYRYDGTLEMAWVLKGNTSLLPARTIVSIDKVEWIKENAVDGTLEMRYEVLSTIEAEVRDMIYAEDEDDKKTRLIAVIPADAIDSKNTLVSDSFTEQFSYIATTSIHGIKYPFVLPASCVIKDEDDGEDSGYIYVIKETKKVWGTEYSLKKTSVKIKDENGEYVAIADYPGEHVLLNANHEQVLRYYDGLLVKMKEEQ